MITVGFGCRYMYTPCNTYTSIWLQWWLHAEICTNDICSMLKLGHIYEWREWYFPSKTFCLGRYCAKKWNLILCFKVPCPNTITKKQKRPSAKSKILFNNNFSWKKAGSLDRDHSPISIHHFCWCNILETDRTCDWMDGKWVRDTRLVYREGTPSGYRHCLVDDRQNCKRNNAHSHYLGYRWVLNDESCEAKRITFTRGRFLSTVKNMKIAFVGDSLTRNMFQSLVCLLYVPLNKNKMVEEHMYRYR